MFLKIKFFRFFFELSFEEREMKVLFRTPWHKDPVIHYEKYFYLKCTSCGQEFIDEGDNLLLCEDHREEMLQYFKKRLK